MKILMIAPTPFFSDRGCHVRILEEIKTLQELNHQVTLVTYHLGKEVKNINTVRTIEIPWYKKTEAGASYHKLYLDILLILKTIECIIKEKPDIIHAHLHEGASIALAAKTILLNKTPLLLDSQGSLTKEMQDHGYLKNKAIYTLFKLIERFIEKNVTVKISSTSTPQYMPLLDAVDINKFKKKKSNLKEELNLPNHPLIVYLGVLDKYQGIDLLLETIALVTKEIKVHFLIMGYPKVEYYKKLAKKLNVEEYVTFTGRINYDLAPEYLSLGDIAISLKLSETEANGKVYNYMACSLPTIVIDNKTNREIGEGTLKYVQANKEAIKETIITLLKDQKLAKELGKNAREQVIKKHSWEKRGKQLEEIYKKCQRSR